MFEESLLNKSIRIVKENSYFMHKALEAKNIKEVLKYSDTFLSELRHDNFIPKDYYTLFFLIFDELSKLQKELTQQPKIKKYNLYDTVQFSKKIIPRLYLLITVGAVYVDNKIRTLEEVVWDTFKLLKGVQHPCRGLFLRYYFLKTLKERVENQPEGLSVDTLIELLMQNLREMNSLWIRINSLIEDKKLRRAQRKDLAVVVGENIMQMALLESVDLNIYKEKILPRLLEIILENKDRIAQEYLFDILLSAFEGEFHVETLQTILDATKRLNKRVNINTIYLKLMERFANFAESQQMEEGEEKKDLSQMTFIYDHFKSTIESIIGQKKYPLESLLKLISGFATFTVNFYNKRLDYVDEIFKMTKKLCDEFPKEDIEKEKCVSSLLNILTVPLRKLALLVLNIPQYPVLMELLPTDKRKNVSTEICRSIITTNTYLVTESICVKLTKFMSPLFSVVGVKESELELVGRVFHNIETAKFKENMNMIKLFESNFDRNNRVHLKTIFPMIINRIIKYVNKTTLMRKEEGDEQLLIKKHANLDKAVYLDSEEIEKYQFSRETDLTVDLKETITYLYSLTKEIEVEHPLHSLQLWLDIMLVVNDYNCQEEHEELLFNCITRVMTIFENDIGSSKERKNHFYKILGYFGNLNNYSEDLLEHIFNYLKTTITLLLTRKEQARAVLSISNLFFGRNNERLKECIQGSWKLAEMSMKYEKGGLTVFVKILDSIISYVEKGLSEFNPGEVEACLAIIDKNIEECKNDEDEDNDEYINNTIKYKNRVVAYWKKNATNTELLSSLNK